MSRQYLNTCTAGKARCLAFSSSSSTHSSPLSLYPPPPHPLSSSFFFSSILSCILLPLLPFSSSSKLRNGWELLRAIWQPLCALVDAEGLCANERLREGVGRLRPQRESGGEAEWRERRRDLERGEVDEEVDGRGVWKWSAGNDGGQDGRQEGDWSGGQRNGRVRDTDRREEWVGEGDDRHQLACGRGGA